VISQLVDYIIPDGRMIVNDKLIRMEFCKGLITPHCKKLACYEMLHWASDWDGILWTDLGNGKWI
jgi:hypothetical protein